MRQEINLDTTWKFLNPNVLLLETEKFYSDPCSPEIVYGQAKRVLNLLQGSEGDKIAAAGIWGFPSYIGSAPITEPAAEFLRFIKDYQDRLVGVTEFECPACYNTSQTTDPRSLCVSCDKSAFKPRDFQKVVPDLDVFIVHNNLNDSSINQMTQTLSEEGYYPSDYDLAGAMTQVGAAYLAPEEYAFPVDMHFIDKQAYIDWSQKFIPGNTESYLLQLSSWYGVHTSVEERYIGNGTVSTQLWLGMNDEIHDAVRAVTDKIRLDLGKAHGINSDAEIITLLNQIRKASPHLDRLAQQEYYKNRMLQRIKENLLI